MPTGGANPPLVKDPNQRGWQAGGLSVVVERAAYRAARRRQTETLA